MDDQHGWQGSVCTETVTKHFWICIGIPVMVYNSSQKHKRDYGVHCRFYREVIFAIVEISCYFAGSGNPLNRSKAGSRRRGTGDFSNSDSDHGNNKDVIMTMSSEEATKQGNSNDTNDVYRLLSTTAYQWPFKR